MLVMDSGEEGSQTGVTERRLHTTVLQRNSGHGPERRLSVLWRSANKALMCCRIPMKLGCSCTVRNMVCKRPGALGPSFPGQYLKRSQCFFFLPEQDWKQSSILQRELAQKVERREINSQLGVNSLWKDRERGFKHRFHLIPLQFIRIKVLRNHLSGFLSEWSY